MRPRVREPSRRRPGLGRRGGPALLGRRDGAPRRQAVPLAARSAHAARSRTGRSTATSARWRCGGTAARCSRSTTGSTSSTSRRGRLDLIQLVDAEQPRTRLNDGKCDRRGRFFAGGMDDKEELAICGLWRLDPDLRVTKVDGGIICSNGPCWSPDDRTFYFADTFQGEFWAYDYDIETGTPRQPARCSRRSRTTPASPTARRSTRRAACGTRSSSPATSSGTRPTAPSSAGSACRCATSPASCSAATGSTSCT